jgi:4-hydroxybenzoate polyprenyltransferase
MLTSGSIRVPRMRDLAMLMRWHQPVGFLLLLWPTLWALWAASSGRPSPRVLVVALLGVVVMRSGGCVINDYADRHFDGHVARTRNRPLVTGRVRPTEALALFAALVIAAFILVLQTNSLTVGLAPAGLAATLLYPFAKRVTYFPQVLLALAWAWCVPMIFAAEANRLPIDCWLLYLGAAAWVVAYDTIYAMVDRDDDKALGLKSTAIFFGRADRIFIAVLQVVTVTALGAFAVLRSMPWPFLAGLIVAAALFIWQQHLIRERGRAECYRAFLNNQWAAGSIFAGFFFS